MEQWYYAKMGQQHGPVTKAELIKLFENGELTPEILVWTDGMQQWLPAEKVDGLIPQSPEPLPPSNTPATSPVKNTQPRVHEPECSQVRPWVRYWARTFDLFVFSMLSGIILGPVAPHLATNANILGIVLLFNYIFFEAAMLATRGTTPGKALLKVGIRKMDGTPISYADALKRSFKVWFIGLGLGIPFVSMLTQIIAYNRLITNGITTWDAEDGFLISHKTIGGGRILLLIAVMGSVLLAAVAGSIA